MIMELNLQVMNGTLVGSNWVKKCAVGKSIWFHSTGWLWNFLLTKAVMEFIDLEIAYYGIYKEIMWWIIYKTHVASNFIDVIKGLCDGVVTNMRM